MIERLASGYQPNFDIDAKVGRQGEMFIAQVCQALAGGASVEVKTDARFAQTGNVYIEFACLKSAGWKPSGIAVTEAEIWAFCLGEDAAFVVPTIKLRDACRRLYLKGYVRECGRGSHPTKGVVVPLLVLLAELRESESAAKEQAA